MRQRVAETDAKAVLGQLEALMALQLQLIDLGSLVLQSHRLQLLFIFFQACAIIVFNSYHLVIYLLRVAIHHETNVLDITMALLHYGYYIIAERIDILLTVVAFSLLSKTFREMLRLLNKFQLYAADEALRKRLSQLSFSLYSSIHDYSIYGLYNLDGAMISTVLAGTVTYVVILIQYGGGNV